MSFRLYHSFLLICLFATLSGINQTNALYLPPPSDIHHSKDASLSRRDIYSPKITNPHKGDLWIVGSEVTVRWDVSQAPKEITDREGVLILGYLNDTQGNDSEHLDMGHSLARNFDILSGWINIQVPNVTCGEDCILVLMGDSGNRSQKFTIKPQEEAPQEPQAKPQSAAQGPHPGTNGRPQAEPNGNEVVASLLPLGVL